MDFLLFCPFFFPSVKLLSIRVEFRILTVYHKQLVAAGGSASIPGTWDTGSATDRSSRSSTFQQAAQSTASTGHHFSKTLNQGTREGPASCFPAPLSSCHLRVARSLRQVASVLYPMSALTFGDICCRLSESSGRRKRPRRAVFLLQQYEIPGTWCAPVLLGLYDEHRHRSVAVLLLECGWK